jgi:hypothetical protein
MTSNFQQASHLITDLLKRARVLEEIMGESSCRCPIPSPPPRRIFGQLARFQTLYHNSPRMAIQKGKLSRMTIWRRMKSEGMTRDEARALAQAQTRSKAPRFKKSPQASGYAIVTPSHHRASGWLSL